MSSFFAGSATVRYMARGKCSNHAGSLEACLHCVARLTAAVKHSVSMAPDPGLASLSRSCWLCTTRWRTVASRTCTQRHQRETQQVTQSWIQIILSSKLSKDYTDPSASTSRNNYTLCTRMNLSIILFVLLCHGIVIGTKNCTGLLTGGLDLDSLFASNREREREREGERERERERETNNGISIVVF